jgi:CheY-like chemotaxis protein
MPTEPGAAPRTVLVVDDDEDVQTFVALLLGDAGYQVERAWNGLEALQKIRAARPDLVVLDIMMPVMDGWEVLAQLKKLGAAPPVLVLSAYADCDEARREGAADCMMKPFLASHLVRACQKMIA